MAQQSTREGWTKGTVLCLRGEEAAVPLPSLKGLPAPVLRYVSEFPQDPTAPAPLGWCPQARASLLEVCVPATGTCAARGLGTYSKGGIRGPPFP